MFLSYVFSILAMLASCGAVWMSLSELVDPNLSNALYFAAIALWAATIFTIRWAHGRPKEANIVPPGTYAAVRLGKSGGFLFVEIDESDPKRVGVGRAYVMSSANVFGSCRQVADVRVGVTIAASKQFPDGMVEMR